MLKLSFQLKSFFQFYLLYYIINIKNIEKHDIISFIYYLIILRKKRDMYLKVLSFDENRIAFRFRRNRFLVYLDCLIFDIFKDISNINFIVYNDWDKIIIIIIKKHRDYNSLILLFLIFSNVKLKIFYKIKFKFSFL